MTTYYGVYRVLKSGEHRYVSRTCTHSKKLAEDIAKELTAGNITMPDGSLKKVIAQMHIVKEIP